MRSVDVQQMGMFAYISVEDRVPPSAIIRSASCACWWTRSGRIG